jgi:hypothetical protein
VNQILVTRGIICRNLLLSLNRFEDTTMKDLIIHLRKDAEVMGCGSSTADLSKVLLCCEILWCSTVLNE